MANTFTISHSIIDKLPLDISEFEKEMVDAEVKFVGGLFNVSDYDKRKWVEEGRKSLLLHETGTDKKQLLLRDTTHLVWDSGQLNSLAVRSLTSSSGGRNTLFYPAARYKRMQSSGREWVSKNIKAHYRDGQIWAVDGPNTATVKYHELIRVIQDKDHPIAQIHFGDVTEVWTEDRYVETKIGDKWSITFKNGRLNSFDNVRLATKWLRTECRGGFNPFGEILFLDPEDEYIFITEFC